MTDQDYMEWVASVLPTPPDDQPVVVDYDSNNSGGSWWLDDYDWYALEQAGWVVHWKARGEDADRLEPGGRWLGALATEAHRAGLTLEEAIAEFEEVTGQDAYAHGCSCCGPPHNFYVTPVAEWYASDWNTRWASIDTEWHEVIPVPALPEGQA